MTSDTLIQAITFDFWDTLFVGTYAGDVRVRRIKETFDQADQGHISEAQIEAAITHAWREWDRVWEQEQRTFGAEHWVALVLADLGAHLPPAEHEALVRAMIVSGMDVRPPLVNGLDTLLPRLAEHYRLGLICDTGLSPGKLLRRWMDQNGILRHFTHLTFSDELGVSKPHPRAFLDTLARMGVPPEAAVHIGDYPRTDIAGAQAVGMRAVRFTGVRDWPHDGVRADAEIASFDELEALLARWN